MKLGLSASLCASGLLNRELIHQLSCNFSTRELIHSWLCVGGRIHDLSETRIKERDWCVWLLISELGTSEKFQYNEKNLTSCNGKNHIVDRLPMFIDKSSIEWITSVVWFLWWLRAYFACQNWTEKRFVYLTVFTVYYCIVCLFFVTVYK